MVEVLKTNVEDGDHAKVLVEKIHENFPFYKANFDLDDCDRILRVESKAGTVDADLLIRLLDDYGYEAGVLGDEILSISKITW